MAVAEDTTGFERYNFMNYEFLIFNEDKSRNSSKILQSMEEVNQAKETPTYYIQEGDHLFPVNSRVLLDDPNFKEFLAEEEDAGAVKKDVQCDQTIIYCTPEQYAEYLQMFAQDEDQEAASYNIGNEFEDESLKEVDDNVQGVPVQDMSDMEDSNGSNSTADYVFYDELLRRPNYQFAVLKDGQLHLQSLNIEAKQKEQLEAFQASINFDVGSKNGDTETATDLGLNQVSGKNIISGPTVMDNKIPSNVQNNYINKKVVIGKTSNGKKLIGKILHFQKGGTQSKSNTNKIELQENHTVLKTKSNIHHDGAANSNLAHSIIETVNKVLVGLMNLQNVCEKLCNKKVIVEFFRVTNSTEDVFLVFGSMKNVDDKWMFDGTKVLDYKANKNYELCVDEDDLQPIKKGESTKELEELVKDIAIERLTLFIVINSDGKTATKINMHPNPSVSNQSENGFEIQLHNKLFGCDECFHTFGNETLLGQHKRIHHVEPWYGTTCTVCNKKFTSVSSMKRHFTIHNPSLRPLQCSVCLQRFTDKSSLRKHLLIHTGIRAYVCKVCHHSFINQSDLTFHSRIHDPIKQFVCDVCGREFSRQSNLIRHSEIHLGDSALYKCHICGCSYSFASSLTRHIVHKHR